MRTSKRLAVGAVVATVTGVLAVAASQGPAVAGPAAGLGGPAGHTVAQSSVGYPFHVGRWDSVRVTVDFGRSFTSVSKVCLTARFGRDDPVEANEEIFVDYPEQAGETDPGGPHFLMWSNYRERHFSTIHTWRQCVTPDNVRTPLDPARWLDGREVLYVEGSDINGSDDGTATIDSIAAQLYE
jgi:hypothetical protein